MDLVLEKLNPRKTYFMIQEQLVSEEDLKSFNIAVEPIQKKEPEFEYVNEILNPKKSDTL